MLLDEQRSRSWWDIWFKHRIPVTTTDTPNLTDVCLSAVPSFPHPKTNPQYSSPNLEKHQESSANTEVERNCSSSEPDPSWPLVEPRKSVHRNDEQNRWQRAALLESNMDQDQVRLTTCKMNQAPAPVVHRLHPNCLRWDIWIKGQNWRSQPWANHTLNQSIVGGQACQSNRRTPSVEGCF